MPVDVQQPLGQDVASQTHCPLAVLHSWPTAHALQVAPLAPQEPFDSPDSGSQVMPLQQPVHEAPPHEQSPIVQSSPDPHVPQVAPPVPHADTLCAA